MDEFRKQLDALMGANRNGDKPLEKKYFTDDDVCKPYLCAVCPHDLFGNTKADMGPCEKLHTEMFKADYEEARKTRSLPFELDVERYLESFLVECDKKIVKAQKRLEETQGVDPLPLANKAVPEQASGLGEIISEQINQLYKQAERLGEEGKVDESMELLKKAEELKEKRQAEQAATERAGQGQQAAAAARPGGLAQPQPQLLNASVPAALLESLPAGLTGSMTQQQQQKLRVCDVCASLLSIYDSDRRLADHFGGKLHLGYMLLREKVAEMKANRERNRERERERDRTRDRDRTERDRRSDDRRSDDRRRSPVRDRREERGSNSRDERGSSGSSRDERGRDERTRVDDRSRSDDRPRSDDRSRSDRSRSDDRRR